MISNLVHNAIEASAGGQVVDVAILLQHAARSEIAVEVKDEGHGISPEDRDRCSYLFSPRASRVEALDWRLPIR